MPIFKISVQKRLEKKYYANSVEFGFFTHVTEGCVMDFTFHVTHVSSCSVNQLYMTQLYRLHICESSP